MHIAHSLLAERQIYKITGATKVISFRQQDPAVVIKTTPTLVFLHGFNGNSASWRYQFSHFQTCRVLSIDAPGFGETSFLQGGMAGFAEVVIQMLYDLGLKSFWLVGHSMGGMLAQIIAAKTGDNCRGCLLYTSPSPRDEL